MGPSTLPEFKSRGRAQRCVVKVRLSKTTSRQIRTSRVFCRSSDFSQCPCGKPSLIR
jgi:hypothetical protein